MLCYNSRSIHDQHFIVSGSHDWYSIPSIIHEATIIEQLSGRLLCLIEHHQAVVVGGVNETYHFVQRVQSVAQFPHLSPQNRVLSFHVEVHLRRDAYVCVDLCVLLFKLIQLGTQTFQVLLFPYPRSTCRFPIGQHSLPLPLFHDVSVSFRTRVLKRTGTR